MRRTLTFILIVLAAMSVPARATVNVVTTTPDLADFVRIAGETWSRWTTSYAETRTRIISK